MIWSCAEHRGVRSEFYDSLRARGRQPNVPVRDILALRDLEFLKLIYVFLTNNNIRL